MPKKNLNKVKLSGLKGQALLVDNKDIVEEAMEMIEPLQPKVDLVPESDEQNTQEGDS